MRPPFRNRNDDGGSRFTFQNPSSADANRRRGDAALIAGGEDRFSALVDFAENGFGPAAQRERLREDKKRLEKALDSGPFDDAIPPLQRMDEAYARALGLGAKTPEPIDPLARPDTNARRCRRIRSLISSDAGRA